MPFTNLNKKTVRPDRVAYSRSQKKKRSGKKMLIRLILILLILGLAIYLPVRGVYQSTKQLNASAKKVSEAVKKESLDDIRKNLKEMKSSADGLHTSLGMLFWVGFIPYFGGFYSDAQHFATAAGYELSAVNKLADFLDPYKTELGFTGQVTPGSDRMTQFVKIMDKVIPQLDKVIPEMKKASEEVAGIDVEKYPEKFGKTRLRSRIDTAKNFITGATYAVTEARLAIEAAPSALGQPDPKNYLLIFQNDKELRPTGGFMTAYAFLKLDKGRVSSSTSDDIYRLDEKLLNVCLNKVCALTPPTTIVKYLPEVNGKPRTAWSMRDSNISPDLPTSMKNFERMYGYLSNAENFDGIITIDTHVVEELIKITGPIEVYGTSYSSDMDQRCNCPNVIYELENYAQIIEKGEADRKAILGTLMQQILARSLGASTDKLPEFINAGVKLANAKHIQLYMHNQKTQDALAKLNWTGQIKDFSGDYLHINDSNFAGGKSNLYVTQNVKLDIDKNGHHKLTIDYKNPQPYNTWLNGINRDYVRIYVPRGAKLTNSKGSDVKVTTIDEELGKTVFEAFIQIRPQNSRQLVFEYNLPNPSSENPYPIFIQKQGGTKSFSYEIRLNGQIKAKFNLDSDKELRL